jgi:branched-chain amino acid aminotransferase
MNFVPIDNREGFIWMDGGFTPWREAKIHVLTHGLHYASSIFEGTRLYSGHVFKLAAHMERLKNSATLMGFTLPYSVIELENATLECVKRNNLTDGYIRHVAWRGSEALGVSAPMNRIHVAIAAWEWPSYYSAEMREKGVKLALAKYRRPPADCAPVQAKAAGLYMICTISKHAAEAEGANDALMLDYRGRVAEATGANFFMAVDGKLVTPEADCFLNGITRQTVIHLAHKRGIAVTERAILPEELGNAEECFLTGTAAEVTAIGEIDMKELGGARHYKVGPITRQLREDYETLVRHPG